MYKYKIKDGMGIELSMMKAFRDVDTDMIL